MITLTWDQIMEAVFSLSKKLQGRKVYGIPRGGTLIATLLSYRGCELTTDSPPHYLPSYAHCAPNTLFVDDIADSGETLQAFSTAGYETAALFVRRGCEPMPNFFSHIINAPGYVKFPYESMAEAADMEAKGEYRSHG